MVAIIGQQLGVIICKKLGLDPNKVARINMSITPSDLVEVNVVYNPSMDEIDSLVEEVSKFRVTLEFKDEQHKTASSQI